jgi:hypothetical protein
MGELKKNNLHYRLSQNITINYLIDKFLSKGLNSVILAIILICL